MRGLGERELDLGLAQGRFTAADLTVERGAADEESAQQEILGRSSSERPDERSRLRIQLAAGEQRCDARMLLERGERLRAVRQHGEIASIAELGGEPLQGRGGVEPDDAARADQGGQLLRDDPLRSGVAAGARLEPLRPDRHRAAAHAVRAPLVDEDVEVSADRHLAHVELGGELANEHGAVGVEPASDGVEPFEALQIHERASRVVDFGAPAPC